MRAINHRWRLSARVGADRKCLFFRCPCGFAAMQAPDGPTFPEAFVHA